MTLLVAATRPTRQECEHCNAEGRPSWAALCRSDRASAASEFSRLAKSAEAVTDDYKNNHQFADVARALRCRNQPMITTGKAGSMMARLAGSGIAVPRTCVKPPITMSGVRSGGRAGHRDDGFVSQAISPMSTPQQCAASAVAEMLQAAAVPRKTLSVPTAEDPWPLRRCWG